MALVIVACSSDPDPVQSGPTKCETQAGTATTCTTDDECGTGPCRLSVCSAGRCVPNGGLDGTLVESQIAGDCSRIVCNVDGSTRAIADDSDIDVASECVTSTCSGGTKATTPKAAGTACTGGLCDGAGTCAVGIGNECSKGEDCPSGFCTDGVCCNEACGGTCKTCNVAGAKGICSDVPYYEEDLSFTKPGGGTGTCDSAVAGSRCDGKGKCLKEVGVTCTQGSQCFGGSCESLKCLGAPGEACSSPSECASGMCSTGACK